MLSFWKTTFYNVQYLLSNSMCFHHGAMQKGIHHFDEYVWDVPPFNETCSHASNTFSKPKENILETSLRALFVHFKSPLHPVMNVILIIPSWYFPTFTREWLQSLFLCLLYKLVVRTHTWSKHEQFSAICVFFPAAILCTFFFCCRHATQDLEVCSYSLSFPSNFLQLYAIINNSSNWKSIIES